MTKQQKIILVTISFKDLTKEQDFVKNESDDDCKMWAFATKDIEENRIEGYFGKFLDLFF